MGPYNCLSKRIFTSLLLLLLFVTGAKGQCTFTISSSASTICAGQSVTLSASGTSNYTWTPGGNGSTVVHTPLSTQVYTVEGSDGICTTTQTLSVVVIPVPTVAAISNTPVVCSGGSAVLSYTGNASGVDGGYYWLPGMSTSQSITVSPSSSSIYTVVAYNGGGACTASTTIQLSIYANPSLGFSVSESSLCSGSQLTITPSGAATYTILPGNYTTTSEFYLTASTTQYTVSGKDVNTCISSAVVPVTVAPSPSLVISQTPSFVCAGQSTTLFTSGADVYNWQPGNFSSGTIVVTSTTSVYYTVTGYNSTGCMGVASADLVVNSSPSLTFVNTSFSICQGGALTLSITGANTYTWLPSNNTGSLLTVSPSGNTVYTVTGTHLNSCIQTAYAGISVVSAPVLSIAGASSICAGSSLTLTGSGSSTYTWAPGNVNTSSIIVSPSASQAYTLAGHNAAGCTGSTTATVSVNPLPVLGLSSTNSSICLGQSVDIIATGAQSYTWLPGNINSASISPTPDSTTYYMVSGDLAGCSSQDSIQIVVLPVPLLQITGDTTICEGSLLSLQATGATTYSWMPFSVQGSQYSITPTASMQVSLTGMNSFGCMSELTKDIVVSPTPTLVATVSPTSSCGQQTHTLTVAGAGSYTWQPGNVVVSTFTLLPSSSQVYNVTGSLGDCVSTASASIEVLPVPDITVTTTHTLLCMGESATLTVSGATSYSWAEGSVNDSLVIWPVAMSSHLVSGTNAEGCTTTFTFVQQVSDCTGLNEVAGSITARVFPNPNEGKFALDISFHNGQSFAIKLYNVQGQLIFSDEKNSFPANIDVRGIEAGFYALTVSGAGKQPFVSRVLITN